MQRNLVTAIAIAVAVLLWLFSGFIFEPDSGQEYVPLAEQLNASETREPAKPPAVQIRLLEAKPRQRVLVLRGKTESKRRVDIKAQVAGAVVRRAVERGDRVKEGALLCELAVDDRRAAVEQASAQVRQADIEYKGARKLRAQGLQSETAVAAAEARLESARALLAREKIALQKTRLLAPFDGVVDRLHMHVGDFASVGSACVTLLELDPMLVTANVAEADVEHLQVGAAVRGRTSTGREIEGVVSFVASQSDAATRTYPVEITVANPDNSIRSGLSTQIELQLNEVMAHLVSPSLFTLDDRGQIGVRVVDSNNVVQFFPVALVEDTARGAWVTGLPHSARLITVGQEFVLAGQTVKPVIQEAAAIGNLAEP